MECEKCSKQATEVVSGNKFHPVCDDHCATLLSTNGYHNNYHRIDLQTRDEILKANNGNLNA